MRTGIVTWTTYNNFGTLLQAYALKSAIIRIGHQCEVIDDSPLRLDNAPKSNPIRSLLAKTYNYILHRDFVVNTRRSVKMYKHFREKFISSQFKSNQTDEINSSLDVIVCGSDQIWSTAPGIFNPYYYADFFTKKKIAYAPSVGRSVYPKDFFEDNTKKLLLSFSHLSLREESCIPYLSKELGKPISNVLDPTLLLDSVEWSKLASDIKEDYVLCYLLTYNPVYLEYVKEFADRKGLKLKIFAIDKRFDGIGEIVAAGPSEFLSYIKSARFFFTDSFHGTIFGIHFETPMFVFKRFSDKTDNNQNSRIINLFKKLNIDSSYFISENELSIIPTLKPFDYKAIKTALADVRRQSLSYLKKAIEE